MDDQQPIIAQISNKSNDELLRMLEGNPDDYQAFAWEVAQQELARRGGRDAVLNQIAEAQKQFEEEEKRTSFHPEITVSLSSLLIWSFINIGVWFLARFEGLSSDTFIQEASWAFLMIAHVNLIIGLLMFLGTIFVRAVHPPSIILFDGIFIFFLGIWNLSYNYWALNITPPPGYFISKIDSKWLAIGSFQLIWGVSRLWFYWRHRIEFKLDSITAPPAASP